MDLNRLEQLTFKLQGLLKEREEGISMWWIALGKMLTEIGTFIPEADVRAPQKTFRVEIVAGDVMSIEEVATHGGDPEVRRYEASVTVVRLSARDNAEAIDMAKRAATHTP